MSGRAYQSTRLAVNRFPSPFGWDEPLDQREVLPSGFEGGYFVRGSEIVISFAGTGPGDVLSQPDWSANLNLANGTWHDQLGEAAAYYLQVRQLNPEAAISFTGHSLGGGLASLLGVFFGRQAVTFDQAPFRASATIAMRDELVNYLHGRGYTDAQLAVLAPGAER
jgi:hypothetical protein